MTMTGVIAAAAILAASPASASQGMAAFASCHAGFGSPAARGGLCLKPELLSASLPTPSLCRSAAAAVARQGGLACRGISMALSTQAPEEGEVDGTQMTKKLRRGSRTFSRQAFTMTDEEAMEVGVTTINFFSDQTPTRPFVGAGNYRDLRERAAEVGPFIPESPHPKLEATRRGDQDETTTRILEHGRPFPTTDVDSNIP